MSESKRENKEFTADTTVWYEDGNIVLVAGSTAFRLYKGILASVSPVFSDMFSLAKPDDSSKEGTIDGCPIVRLTASPKDLRWFLKLITTGSVELLGDNTLVSFAQLVATVRIAHKYQAERIVQAAGSRLRRFFTPDVIAELHTQGATAKTWRNLWYQKQQECGVEVPMDGATGVEAVNVARLLGYDDMLPLALLLCCDGDPLQMRNGVQRKDGTVAKLSDSEYLGCIQAIPALGQTLHRLGVEVMRQCARTVPVKGCACKKVLVEMKNEYSKEPFSGPLMGGFVWFSWRSEPPNAYASRAKALCNKCILRVMKTFNEIFSDLQLQVNVDKKTGYVQIVVDVTK